MSRQDMRNLTVEEWFLEIDQGLDYRRKYGLEDSWAELESLYYNVHPSMASNSPNIIAGTGDSFLSELTVPSPYVLVEAMREDAIDGAPIVESVMNNLMYDIEIAEQVEIATLHAYLWGRGFLKIGFDSEFGWNPKYDIGGDLVELGMSFTQLDRKGRRIESGKVRPGMPWIEAVLPHDIVVPWGTRDLDKCPWVFHRIIRHIDDIKADPKYSNKSGLQPVMSMEDYTNTYKSTLKPYRMGMMSPGTSSRKEEFCELWEGRSRRTGRIIVLATGYNKKLRDDVDLLLTNQGYPFADISFVPRARNFWVTPDSYYLKFHQAEQTDISVQASKQRRMGGLKFAYSEDAVDSDEIDKLTSAEVGAGFKVKGSHTLKEAIMTLQPGSNLGLYQDLAQSQQNARAVVGFSLNAQGEFMKGRKTATETQAVNRGGGNRMSRRVHRLRRFYGQASKKTIAILADLWKAPRLAKILGPDGESKWLRFTGEDLRGKYKYVVDFTNTSNESLLQRRQEAINMYMLLSQDPFVDPVELRRYLIKAYNDPELGRIFRMNSDADLRLQMSQMQQGSGGSSQGQASQSPLALPGV